MCGTYRHTLHLGGALSGSPSTPMVSLFWTTTTSRLRVGTYIKTGGKNKQPDQENMQNKGTGGGGAHSHDDDGEGRTPWTD